VQPGAYSLRIEQSGFKTFLRTNIVLTANEHLPVDVKLELGATAETVRVESQGATVNTASSERAGVITAAQLETLQLKGRDYMGMVRLLPGVVDTKNRDAPGFGTNSGFNIQGGRADSSNITLDGVTNADAGNNTGNFYAPSMDAVAEVKVLLTNYQAEYGRNAGATINVIMKSGTREFHGSAYEYKRNEALNANNFFSNLTGLPRRVTVTTSSAILWADLSTYPGIQQEQTKTFLLLFARNLAANRSPGSDLPDGPDRSRTPGQFLADDQ